MSKDSVATSPAIETPSDVTSMEKVAPSTDTPAHKSSSSSIGKADANDVEQDDADSRDYDMSEDESEEEQQSMRAGFAELFRFATKWDIFLNGVGLLMACVAGAAQVSAKEEFLRVHGF
jgi:hypothetical protein